MLNFKNHKSKQLSYQKPIKRVLKSNKKVIYLAGGCFWGVEGYFKKLPGVYETEVGYANGKTDNTDYSKISATDHAETVKVCYDKSRISLEEILLHYFRIIDPLSVNKQGNDIGRQYRTGVSALHRVLTRQATQPLQMIQVQQAIQVPTLKSLTRFSLMRKNFTGQLQLKNPH